MNNGDYWTRLDNVEENWERHGAEAREIVTMRYHADQMPLMTEILLEEFEAMALIESNYAELLAGCKSRDRERLGDYMLARLDDVVARYVRSHGAQDVADVVAELAEDAG